MSVVTEKGRNVTPLVLTSGHYFCSSESQLANLLIDSTDFNVTDARGRNNKLLSYSVWKTADKRRKSSEQASSLFTASSHGQQNERTIVKKRVAANNFDLSRLTLIWFQRAGDRRDPGDLLTYIA